MIQRYFGMIMALCMCVSAMASDGGLHDGEHVVMLGDSNTWIGGDDCSKPRGWNTWFAKRYAPASCRSYARSGATWTNTTRTRKNTVENIGVLGDDNVIYNQIERLAEAVAAGVQPEPTLIFVSAGANDGWFPRKRPGVFDVSPESAFADSTLSCLSPSEVTSLAGSVIYCCDMLRRAYPDARIVLLTPFYMKSVPADNITKVGDIMERCGRLSGVTVVRQDKGCGVDGRTRRMPVTYDGNHTNERGAEILAAFIMDSIK